MLDWIKRFFGVSNTVPEDVKIDSTIPQEENLEGSNSSAANFYGMSHDGCWRCTNCNEKFVNKPFNKCPKDFGTLVSEEKDSEVFTIDGRYEICRPLGFRGITRCLLAYDSRRDCESIVQYLASVDEKTEKRFLKAAERLFGLEHPNIYSVYDAKINGQDGTYFVGEFVQGVTAEDLLEQKKIFDPEEILQIIIAVLNGLEHAHAKQIYHCSLDLSNILVSKMESGSFTAKVMDFGIATRIFDGLDWQGSPESHTQTCNVYGQSDAMAPEVIRGHTPTAKSDIYSVGCCLYETLTGKKVFEREAELFTLFAHINDPPDPFDLALNIPAELEKIVLKCLEKDPDTRFESAVELKEQLQALMSQYHYLPDI